MPNSSLLPNARFVESIETSHTSEAPDAPTSDLRVDAVLGHYNEQAFRYFLEIERRRADLSGRPFLLLLIDLKKVAGESDAHMPAATADTVIGALARCIRETDFVGWYRDGRVAGAVLTQDCVPGPSDMSELVTQRVGVALREHLAGETSDRIQLRVYQLPSPASRQVQQ